MNTKSIKQTIRFNASPDKVYQLLMDQNKHASFTGTKVVMSKEINGKFTVFDGYCHGYNIELVPARRIVQAWHFAEDGWPDDHYSTCTFLFEENGGKTKLVFLQTDVPEHKVEAIKDGWKEFYWDPMKNYLKTSDHS
jgi:activator of HSP90 ATPase